MGDVTMRDFLTTHNLLPEAVRTTAATVTIVPTDPSHNLDALRIAQSFRSVVSATVDISDRKIGKKIGDASQRGARYILVVGEDELATAVFTLKELATGTETKGTIPELLPVVH
jgi:histidyl-tRNA synthetase